MKILTKITLFITLLFFLSCENESFTDLTEDSVTEINTKGNKIKIPAYSFDNDDNSRQMYQDGEHHDSIISPWRKFEIGKVLRVRPIDDTTIEIANFAPIEIENATIMLNIIGQTDTIKLFKISRIRPLGVQRIKYPFIDGNTTKFKNTKNQIVDLSNYSQSGISKKLVVFDFQGRNKTIRKLKKLSMLKWNVFFKDRNPENNPNIFARLDVWPIDARRHLGFVINMASFYVWGKFEEEFLKHPESNTSRDGITSFYPLERKKEIFKSIINQQSYALGVTKKTGMGGGSVFSLGQGQLHIYIHTGFTDTGSHETGHKVGFGHSSSMTYPKTAADGSRYGFSYMTNQLLPEAKEKDVFIVTPENYYQMSDFDEKITTNLPYVGSK